MTDDAAINRDGGLLEYTRRKRMTIQTWSPFQYGTFAGTFINNDQELINLTCDEVLNLSDFLTKK